MSGTWLFYTNKRLQMWCNGFQVTRNTCAHRPSSWTTPKTHARCSRKTRVEPKFQNVATDSSSRNPQSCAPHLIRPAKSLHAFGKHRKCVLVVLW